MAGLEGGNKTLQVHGRRLCWAKTPRQMTNCSRMLATATNRREKTSHRSPERNTVACGRNTSSSCWPRGPIHLQTPPPSERCCAACRNWCSPVCCPVVRHAWQGLSLAHPSWRMAPQGHYNTLLHDCPTSPSVLECVAGVTGGQKEFHAFPVVEAEAT